MLKCVAGTGGTAATGGKRKNRVRLVDATSASDDAASGPRRDADDDDEVIAAVAKAAGVQELELRIHVNAMHAAAVRIQAMWRKVISRRFFELQLSVKAIMAARHVAAVFIQKAWRGHAVRRAMPDLDTRFPKILELTERARAMRTATMARRVEAARSRLRLFDASCEKRRSGADGVSGGAIAAADALSAESQEFAAKRSGEGVSASYVFSAKEEAATTDGGARVERSGGLLELDDRRGPSRTDDHLSASGERQCGLPDQQQEQPEEARGLVATSQMRDIV